MKFKSQIMTAASGSVGGLTASHNRGGQYFRARTIPVNPGSQYQQDVRNAINTLTSRWRTTLTPSQRSDWQVWADNSPRTDSLGEQRIMTGLQAYCSMNTPRIQASLSIVDAPDAQFGFAVLTNPGITSITASTKVIIVTFTNTDEWAGAAGGALLVYASRPTSPAINFFKGPYRYAGKISGAATPPTSPANITGPFALDVAQLQHVQFRAVTALGRISAPFRLSKECT